MGWACCWNKRSPSQRGQFVASGADMVFLQQKLAPLALASPISLFILLHFQSPCSFCNLKSISLPNPLAKHYLLLPHSCCRYNTHFSRHELTDFMVYSFLLLIFPDANLLSGLPHTHIPGHLFIIFDFLPKPFLFLLAFFNARYLVNFFTEIDLILFSQIPSFVQV